MVLSQYCKSHGMNLVQYKQYVSNINAIANAIYQNSATIHKHDTGMYFPLVDIMNITEGITDTGYHIMDALKTLGMEFMTESNTIYYRA